MVLPWSTWAMMAMLRSCIVLNSQVRRDYSPRRSRDKLEMRYLGLIGWRRRDVASFSRDSSGLRIIICQAASSFADSLMRTSEGIPSPAVSLRIIGRVSCRLPDRMSDTLAREPIYDVTTQVPRSLTARG